MNRELHYDQQGVFLSAEFEPCAGLNGIQQLLLHLLLVLELREFEEVHASGGRGEVTIPYPRGDHERGVEFLEPQEWRATAAGHKL